MASPKCIDCRLTLVNLHNEDEYAELKRQRHLCGWNYQDEVLTKWRGEITNGTKSLFWITVKLSNSVSTTLPGTPNGHLATDPKEECWHERIGHASLDSQVSPPDPEICRPDRTLLTISTFFILPHFQRFGAGRLVMNTLESYATEAPYGSPTCEAIALHTVSRQHYEDEGPNGKGFWDLVDPNDRQETLPEKGKGRTNEDWYARRGYVKWKVEPRYPVRMLDGSTGRINAVFMRKELGLKGRPAVGGEVLM